MKKRGFGAGWWNGFGGKLLPNEDFEAAAIREVQEEVGLQVHDLQLVARLLFYFQGQAEILANAYTSSSFGGKPTETDEMKPKWFPRSNLPFDEMWPGDKHWVPQAISQRAGSDSLFAEVYFGEENKFERINLLDEAQFARITQEIP